VTNKQVKPAKPTIVNCPGCGASVSSDSETCMYCHRLLTVPAPKKKKDDSKQIKRLLEQNKELTNVVISMTKEKEYEAVMEQHKAAFMEQIRAIKAQTRVIQENPRYTPMRPYNKKPETTGGCLIKLIVFWFLFSTLFLMTALTDMPASFAGMVAILILILLFLWSKSDK
jgi:RNase H-fold protein (predicted Holliday junction resolvase)